MSLEPRIRERLDALGSAPRAELLHVEMLPDSEREAKADEIVERGRSPGWWQSPGQVVGAPDGLDLVVLDTVERAVAFFRPGPELPDSVPADVLGDVPGPGPTPLLDRSQEPSEWPLLLLGDRGRARRRAPSRSSSASSAPWFPHIRPTGSVDRPVISENRARIALLTSSTAPGDKTSTPRGPTTRTISRLLCELAEHQGRQVESRQGDPHLVEPEREQPGSDPDLEHLATVPDLRREKRDRCAPSIRRRSPASSRSDEPPYRTGSSRSWRRGSDIGCARSGRRTVAGRQARLR
jgi:hypothetical protein